MPGLENVVADALSRQYDDSEPSAIVNAISHSLSDINLSELADEQPRIEDELATSLKLSLVTFQGVERPLVCDTSLGRPRIVVPLGRRRLLFEAIHNLAHPSGKSTVSLISRSYAWPGIRRDILGWSRGCRTCELSKVARHTRPPIKPIPVLTARFSHVHVDIVGPFTPDRGFTHLLTIVDRTTRWPEAVPIASTTAEAVIQAFLDVWVSRFGIPETVTTDRGRQFTSEAWQGCMSRLGINVSLTTSYHPQSNGLVERFHRTLKNSLRCAVRSCKSWSRSLPWVMLGLQSAPKTDTATSTAGVLYGTPLRIPGLCFQSNNQATATEQLKLARTNVTDFTPESLDLCKFKTSPFVSKSLRTAGYVYVRDDRLGKASLEPKYTGPFKVVRKDWDNNTFLLDLGKKQDVVSLSRLKPASLLPEEAT